MTLPLGTLVTSKRDARMIGVIVGYGELQWPGDPDLNGDQTIEPVYLVQIARGSSSLGPACAVFRADQVEAGG